MIKRIIVTTLVVILLGATGVAAYDAYQGNSTLDLSTDDLFAAGQGQGNEAQGQGQRGGQGQGQGRQDQGQGQGQSADMSEPVAHEWVTLTGTVLSTDQQTLTVDTAEQGELTLELGIPGFASEQGVAFNPGDQVKITGFEENGMFQAGQIDNETTGESLLLRDPNGRPLWAGRGQGQGQGGGQGHGQGHSGSQAQTQGHGRGGQGQGQRGELQGQGGQGQQSGLPQATDRDWTKLTGEIVSSTDQNLTVETVEKGQLLVQLGPPGFASQQNVAFNAGDLVTLTGFSGENDLFQAGQITNDTTGQILMLRDPNGRPLWAGRGQGGGSDAGQGQGQNQGQSF